jgi:hypothetical protein
VSATSAAQIKARAAYVWRRCHDQWLDNAISYGRHLQRRRSGRGHRRTRFGHVRRHVSGSNARNRGMCSPPRACIFQGYKWHVPETRQCTCASTRLSPTAHQLCTAHVLPLDDCELHPQELQTATQISKLEVLKGVGMASPDWDKLSFGLEHTAPVCLHPIQPTRLYRHEQCSTVFSVFRRSSAIAASRR